MNEQTERDTKRVESRTKRDTQRAEGRTARDSAPTASTMDERERAAGLTLRGNDPLRGRRERDQTPTMDERERSNGLTGTLEGREDAFYSFTDPFQKPEPPTKNTVTIFPEEPPQGTEPLNTIPVIICVNGAPWTAYIYGQLGGEIT